MRESKFVVAVCIVLVAVWVVLSRQFMNLMSKLKWVCVGLLIFLFGWIFLTPSIMNCVAGRDSYRGIIVDGATGKAIGDAEIDCRVDYWGQFGPTFDGIFEWREGKDVTLRADARGEFSVELDGFNRRMFVYHPGYQSQTIGLSEFKPKERIVIRLWILGD